MPFLLLILAILGTAVTTLQAQLTWGGLFTAEMRKGGEQSNYFTNGIVNNNTSFTLHSLNLFAEAQIEEHIFVTAQTTIDLASNGRLNPLRLYTASVVFTNLFNREMSVEAGRILSPFGDFLSQQLPDQYAFPGLPLIYTMHQNISRTKGYTALPLTGRTDEYSGTSIIYRGGYFNGIKIQGKELNNYLEYAAAVTTGPLSSLWGDTETNKSPAFSGRIGIAPVIWLRAGLSYADGAYLDEAPLRQYVDVQEYRQQTFAVDASFNYTYYNLQFEYLINNFPAPVLGTTGTITSLVDKKLDLKTNYLRAEFKYDVPILPGFFAAVRYESLQNNEVSGNFSANNTIYWNENYTSVSGVLGYKIARSVLLKAGYQNLTNSPSSDVKDDIFILQLVTSF